ncbi:S49 family peptidase, partial [Klebsiella variicola]
MTTKLINLPHLADMVFGVPHYVTRQTMDSVKAVLIPRIQGITEDAAIQMALNPGKSPAAEQVQPTGGVAVIPVHGILVPRRGQITAMCSELTSYERIRGQLQAALNDPSISEIVLDINSGGGAAVGCKELADYIYQSRD